MADYYEMSPQQCILLESIYKRKGVKPTDKIILSKDEIALIGANDPEGLDESKVSFAELGIEWDK